MDPELKAYLDDMRQDLTQQIAESRKEAAQLNHETRQHAEQLNHETRILLEDVRHCYGHGLVESVKVNIGHQWADDRPLTGSFWGRVPLFGVHDAGAEHIAKPSEHRTIGDPFGHFVDQDLLINRTKVVLDIRIHDPVIPLSQMVENAGDGVVGTTPRSKTVAVRAEGRFPDGFHDSPHGFFRHAVPDSRHP